MTIYELRLNGRTIHLDFNFDVIKEMYEQKKNDNPFGYYEIYKRV